MKQIIYTCDECAKQIDPRFDFITTNYHACGSDEPPWDLHFCTMICMRTYLTRKWQEQDVRLEHGLQNE